MSITIVDLWSQVLKSCAFKFEYMDIWTRFILDQFAQEIFFEQLFYWRTSGHAAPNEIMPELGEIDPCSSSTTEHHGP